jgi:hypothetical protein
MALSTRAGANHDWETEALRTPILREAKSSDLPVQSRGDLCGARCQICLFDLVPAGTATVKADPDRGLDVPDQGPLRETGSDGAAHCRPSDLETLCSRLARGPDNPIIAPGAIFPGHANNQLFDVPVNSRSAGDTPRWRSIEFASNEPPVPRQMMSGWAAVATSLSALRPSRKPILPSIARSTSERRRRWFNLALKMRFSAASYSLRRSDS